MKLIGITQRVEWVESHAERRDCLDQRWSTLVCQLGHIPIALPNLPADNAKDLMNAVGLDALIFSGGNSIASLEPSATDAAAERDGFEEAILQEGLDRQIPILGVCRGMQAINVFMGGKLIRIDGHSGQPHPIVNLSGRFIFPEVVNSYHTWAVAQNGLANGLEALAVDNDGNVEALRHTQMPLLAVMWHPERHQPFDPLDVRLIQGLIK